MSEKDYQKLSKSLIIPDMYETDEEPMILCEVASPAERCEEFLEAVEKLAVEHFGGATFRELLDNDPDNEAIRTSDDHYTREQIDAMMKSATKILEDASGRQQQE